MPARSWPVRERIARDIRGDTLRARHKALYTFEINGEHASISWDLHDLHRLQYFDHRDEGRLAGGGPFTSPTAIIHT